jgi:hypothetical protein
MIIAAHRHAWWLPAAAMLLSTALPHCATAVTTTTLTGTLKIEIDVETDATIPNGSGLSISLSANAGSTLETQTVSSGKSVVKSAAKQRVAISLPYRLTYASTPRGISLYAAASANYAAGGGTNASVILTIPLPADGVTTDVTIPLRI